MDSELGSTDPAPPKRRRVGTGIPGLDQVLRGGLLEGGLYVLDGAAGTGKTVLSFQTGLHIARHEGRVLFVTLLAESHGKLIEHNSGFRFYDPAVVARSFTLVSGFGTLRATGLSGFLRMLAEMLARERPRLLVIDGFSIARAFAVGLSDYGQFVLQLGALGSAAGCTTLLVTPTLLEPSGEEWPLVDGIIELGTHANGMRRVRELEVVKLRGGEPLAGRHTFTISDAGITVFPRLEAEFRQPPRNRPEGPRLSTGIPGLDEMLDGGLQPASTTSVMGAPGTGKTVLSLKFLEEGLRRGERALYLGFYESPERLLAKAEALGIELAQAREQGRFLIDWEPPLEPAGDTIAARLLEHVHRAGVQRVVIDSVEGFEDTASRPERVVPMLAALLGHLSGAGVTTVVTEELGLYTSTVESRHQRLSAHVENIVLLRYVEIDAEVRRLISVMKARSGTYDRAIREFTIEADRIGIGSRFHNAERVLSGDARLLRQAPLPTQGAR